MKINFYVILGFGVPKSKILFKLLKEYAYLMKAFSSDINKEKVCQYMEQLIETNNEFQCYIL